jgi:prophage regulatory protein
MEVHTMREGFCEACLRMPKVLEMTGLSRPTLYREIAQGRFPRPIKLTAASRAWKLSEIIEWIESRERGAAPAAESEVADE